MHTYGMLHGTDTDRCRGLRGRPYNDILNRRFLIQVFENQLNLKNRRLQWHYFKKYSTSSIANFTRSLLEKSICNSLL